MTKSMRRLLLPLSMLMATGASHAEAYEFGQFQVVGLRVGGGGTMLALSPAPAACRGGDHYRMHLSLTPSDPNYKEMVATLLLAHATGRKLTTIFFNGSECSPNHVLTLTMLETAPSP